MSKDFWNQIILFETIFNPKHIMKYSWKDISDFILRQKIIGKNKNLFEQFEFIFYDLNNELFILLFILVVYYSFIFLN